MRHVGAGLGSRFLTAVEDALAGVTEWPRAAPVWLESPVEIRRARVRGFPYHITYLVDDATIWVLALAHDRCEPGYWHGRLEG